MGIIYGISLVSLLAIFMLIKKSDKKLNALGVLGIGLVLVLCYNIFQCYVLNYFEIKLSLFNLSVINYVIVIWAATYLLIRKKVQKYKITFRDLLSVGSIGIAIFIVACMQYGCPLNIKYETTDPGVHYRASQLFVENESLLNNVQDEIYNFRTFKIGSYVNSGLLMQIVSDNTESFDYYKIFVLFDIYILFLTAYMLYFAFMRISKGKLKFIALIMSLLCVLGYPLNSMLFGFEYLNIGLLLIVTILNMVSYYKSKEIGSKHCIIIFFLLNLGLFCSYYMFVPFMFSGLFIYLCIHHYKNKKKLITLNLICTLLITLIIPFGLGYIYHLAPDYYSEPKIIYERNENNAVPSLNALASSKGSSSNSVSNGSVNTANGTNVTNATNTATSENMAAINAETTSPESNRIITSPVPSIEGMVSDGYIYKNLYSNIILLIPLTFFVLFRERKEFNFSTFMFIFLIGFIGLLFTGSFNGIVSEYYIAKNYFALWVVLWYFNFKGLNYLYEKNKKIPYILGAIYLIIITISYSYCYMGKVKKTFKDISNINVSEVYNVNNYLVRYTKYDFYQWEEELLEYAKNNIDKDKKIEILGTEQQIIWGYDLLDRVTYYLEMDSLGHQDKLRYKSLNNAAIENADYIICFRRTDFYKSYNQTHLLDCKEVVYENAFGKIIKNN